MSQQQQPLDDWEEAADNDQNLSQQTSRINISAQAPSFRPQASTFVPGGQQAYYPQQPYYQQPQQQQMYGNQYSYPQYGQPSYGYQQQGGYGGGYGPQYGGQPQFQPQLLQRGQTPPTQTKKETGMLLDGIRLTFVEGTKSSGLPSLPPPRAPISGNPAAPIEMDMALQAAGATTPSTPSNQLAMPRRRAGVAMPPSPPRPA